uniref:Uncharacterized protein n=1 Tax=Anguilla anguilla TaxID=7936 RepID=A0A0E9WH08_ANGAN
MKKNESRNYIMIILIRILIILFFLWLFLMLLVNLLCLTGDIDRLKASEY